jgi:hypothetical protein
MEWTTEESQHNSKQGKEIFFSQGIQTHLVSHSSNIRGSSPGDHSLPSHAINEALNYTSTLPHRHSVVFKLRTGTSPFVVIELTIMFLQVTLQKTNKKSLTVCVSSFHKWHKINAK